ncbi:hypothetical protein J1614_001935 [Plenodomus biglobosus]|nr:hypothetical protein J1614_001935 [Plenodomus biglobosus]
MQATKPENDQNKCWFCKRNNISRTMTCDCGAATVPTNINQRKTIYRVYSFGYNSKEFLYCMRLHENLLNMAVEILQDNTLVAIRVGSDSEFAILIRDPDGRIRSFLCPNHFHPPDNDRN